MRGHMSLLVLVALLSGCTSGGQGTFALHATDAPDNIGDYIFKPNAGGSGPKDPSEVAAQKAAHPGGKPA